MLICGPKKVWKVISEMTLLHEQMTLLRRNGHALRVLFSVYLVCSASTHIGPCHVSGIFLPLRVNSLPLATIYEVKIPLRKWKNPFCKDDMAHCSCGRLFLCTPICPL
jgi:hypothetical protein